MEEGDVNGKWRAAIRRYLCAERKTAVAVSGKGGGEETAAKSGDMLP